MSEQKKSVEEIIVDRIIKKIEMEQKLPWQKSALHPSMNWYSQYEYKGINRVLLDGGEFITVEQLKKYNKENDTKYWFDSGTPYELVMFFSPKEVLLRGEELKLVLAKGVKNVPFSVIENDGEYYKKFSIKKFTRVYDIFHIHDKEGNKLKPKLGTELIDVHTKEQDIVENYINHSGVKIIHHGNQSKYIPSKDTVMIAPPQNFVDIESYYRELFHELTHSTGTPERLNRDLKNYSKNIGIRSKEELVAEMGSLLLASEAGFKQGTALEDNADSYLLSWLSWLKDNKKYILWGISQAEKAKNFILGKDLDADKTIFTSKKIE